MKDHEIAQVVNKLRDIGIKYGGAQQLRERIAGLITPILHDLTANSFQSVANKVCGEIPEGYDMTVEMENGYGGVSMTGPNGKEINMDDINEDTELSLAEKTEVALRIAVAMER